MMEACGCGGRQRPAPPTLVILGVSNLTLRCLSVHRSLCFTVSWCPGRCVFRRRSDLRCAASLHVPRYHGQTDPIRHLTHSLGDSTGAAGPQGVCTCTGTERPPAGRRRSRRVRSRTHQKYWVRRCSDYVSAKYTHAPIIANRELEGPNAVLSRKKGRWAAGVLVPACAVHAAGRDVVSAAPACVLHVVLHDVLFFFSFLFLFMAFPLLSLADSRSRRGRSTRRP